MELLQSLRVFRRVAELSSFTQAADALSLPKSRVSTIVRDLEAELGVRLFHRTTRRVHLTHEGIALQERARDLLSDADDVRAMFQSGSSLRGSIRVDMPIGVARNVIIPCLHEFMDAHPQVDVELSSTDRRVDLIKEGFDCKEILQVTIALITGGSRTWEEHRRAAGGAGNRRDPDVPLQ